MSQTQQQVANAFTARHPEISNLGPMVDEHNAQRLKEILEHNHMTMTLENLEAAYVAARTRGLLVFHDQQTIENHVFSQPHVKKEQIRTYYESQEPKKQNMADFLPSGNTTQIVDGNLRLDLYSPEIKAKSDPTIHYGDVLKKLSEQLGGAYGGETKYAVLDYVLERNPEYRSLPPERLEKTIEQVIDLMLKNGDPWTIEYAQRRLFEHEAEEAAVWKMMEEQGQKMPQPQSFQEKSAEAENYFFQTASTDAIRGYLQNKYPQGAR